MNKGNFKQNCIKFIIIIGIIIIPLMYSYFYLKAFWDPYSNLEGISVALVNLDKGDGEKNLGQELVDSVLEEDVMDFKVVENKEEAEEGLKNQDYYAIIQIPEDFTENLNNAENSDRQISTITYSPNQKANYLASQIIAKVVTKIETNLRGQIAETVTTTLSDKLNEVPNEMEKIRDGAGTIRDGANTLSDGMGKLNTGVNSLYTNYDKFNSGLSSAVKGSENLRSGIDDLNSGMNELYNGSKALSAGTAELSKVAESASSLTSKVNEFKGGLNQYISGVNGLTNQVNSLLSSIVAYGDANQETIEQDANLASIYQTAKAVKASNKLNVINSSGEKIEENVEKLSQGLSGFGNIGEKLTEFENGITSIENGIEKARNGTETLKEGSNTLVSGMNELYSNSLKIKAGIKDLRSGSSSALAGSETLAEGGDTFKSSIDEAITDTKSELTKLDGLSEYVKEPVKVDEEDYAEVKSYGIGFAPYFMSLSLWIGGLIIFITIYYDVHDRFKYLGRNAENKLLRSGLYALIAIIQALVLGYLLKLGLGFEVNNLLLYYMSCMLIAITFFVIIQFLMVHFGDVGKFLVILFLVLQLSASGGTFPIETVPESFQELSTFMPMTYSVKLLKESIVSSDSGFAWHEASILLAIMAVFAIATIILDILKMKKEKLKKKET